MEFREKPHTDKYGGITNDLNYVASCTPTSPPVWDLEYILEYFCCTECTILRTWKGKTRQDTQLRFYKVMAIPALLYGSEAWTVTARDTSRIHVAEMHFLRAVKGCTRHDRLWNEDIRNEFGVEQIQDKLSNCREKWKTHLEPMPEETIPK
jgi:hypothetical protein